MKAVKTAKASRAARASSPKKEKKLFPVVGIGASAGGLKALETFFSHVPENIGMAFVVVQHLSPHYKSIMGELLKRHTKLDVVEVKDGVMLRENSVYLNPPDKELSLIRGVLHLMPMDRAKGMSFPIDSFFRSLADDRAEQAICILLSGSGTDGTLGLEAVKGAGGMTMAQEEQQAEYSGMPHSAIKTGLVDFVLPVEHMAGEIIKYVKHPYVGGPKKSAAISKQLEAYSQKILLLLRSAKRHDFTHYKQSTIMRRIERRMAVHKLDNIAIYYRYFQENPQESEALFKELLIGVTSFFRDSDAFRQLEERVVPEIVKRHENDLAVRVWVPGCATGEEAFSIAMLIVEAMNRQEKQLYVQIFATDIDGAAIDNARAGVYPESIAADVSPERLKRFFVKEGSLYRIKKEVREMIIFSLQNIVTDPPLSRMDLISCRNLLIYMDGELQKKLVPLFHYALNERGYLFLGTSETIGQFSDLFGAVDLKGKVFQRKGRSARREHDYQPMRFSASREPEHPGAAGEVPRKEKPRKELMEQLLLEHYSAPSVLINEKCEALYFHGATERYLVPPRGEASLNVLKMCREGLHGKLSILLRNALKDNIHSEIQGVHLKQGDALLTMDLSVRPLPGTVEKLFVITFMERKDLAASIAEKGSDDYDRGRTADLEQELQATREHLQSALEAMEISNEELKSANEELQSTNEELQSTNEEVETAKEELQSTNEELVTVNSELQAKVDDLTRANNDINNLLASTDIGTIFLDNALGIKRFTPAMTKLFNLRSTDVGRSIKDITTKITYGALYEEAEGVLETLQGREHEVRTGDGKCFIMRILPYRTLENMIEGVVITFIDATEQKRTEEALQEATEKTLVILDSLLEGVMGTVREPLVALDENLRVMKANGPFYEKFGGAHGSAEGKSLFDIGGGQWDNAPLRELLERILPHRTSLEGFEATLDLPRAGKRTLMLNARQMTRGGDKAKLILLAAEDITGRESLSRSARKEVGIEK
ncbi:MAG: chemotaxis protein CheB [Candidatus Eremiobacteraeota bacterium]|nr:chemotaxis protein CheB [Candidatus Eremiobacteraeota bacterium]